MTQITPASAQDTLHYRWDIPRGYRHRLGEIVAHGETDARVQEALYDVRDALGHSALLQASGVFENYSAREAALLASNTSVPHEALAAQTHALSAHEASMLHT